MMTISSKKKRKKKQLLHEYKMLAALGFGAVHILLPKTRPYNPRMATGDGVKLISDLTVVQGDGSLWIKMLMCIDQVQ